MQIHDFSKQDIVKTEYNKHISLISRWIENGKSNRKLMIFIKAQSNYQCIQYKSLYSVIYDVVIKRDSDVIHLSILSDAIGGIS